jgi:hypothetical protein
MHECVNLYINKPSCNLCNSCILRIPDCLNNGKVSALYIALCIISKVFFVRPQAFVHVSYMHYPIIVYHKVDAGV